MADQMSDERLEMVLVSIADHLVLPTGADAGGLAGRTRRSDRSLRVLAVAAAALLVLVAATMTISPVRDAVADLVEWLDFGSTRIERASPEAGDPSGLLPIEAGLPTVSRAEAERALGRPLPATAGPAIGAPDAFALPPEGGVLLVWRDGRTTLWILPTDDPAEMRIGKLLDHLDTVESVPRLGEAAVFVAGDHVLTTPNRRVAADSVLLWLADGFEYRLESERGRSAMLSTARAIDSA